MSDSVLHYDCVVCQSIAERPTTGQETMVIVCMLLCGHTIDGIYKGLCFVHRRSVDQVAAGMLRDIREGDADA